VSIATATAEYRLGHGLHTFTVVLESSQLSTYSEMVK